MKGALHLLSVSSGASLLLLLLLFGRMIRPVCSFSSVVVSHHRPHHHHHNNIILVSSSSSSSSLYARHSNNKKSPDDKDGDDKDNFDVDQMRQRLEALLVGGGSSSSQQNAAQVEQQQQVDSQLAHIKSSMLKEKKRDFLFDEKNAGVLLSSSSPPPLTSIDRERREAEIIHLSRLVADDDALADLWTLWFQERGAAASARLQRTEELVAQRAWSEAEDGLRELIEEYGVYWTEPVNRLATLYFLQGKLKESEALCKIVLEIKPWHFGALSGIVLIYAAMQDSQAARMWAARRLPTFAPEGANRRREIWVEQALAEASKSLNQAEKRLKSSFGKPDERLQEQSELSSDGDDDWQ